MADLLEVEGLRKRFGGVRAVEAVSFTVPRGSLHGVIGPNGSGKTTLFNIISGIYRPDAGAIRLDGTPIDGRAAHVIARRGVARTFQNLRLFASMTALENVLVGLAGYARAGASLPADPFVRPWVARSEERQLRARAMDLLASVGLSNDAHARATSLPYGKQRKVEIARALATDPRLLLLDEPAAGLNADETSELDAFLQSLMSGDVTIVMIEHDMRLVMGICSGITVLDRGSVIAHGPPQVVRDDPKVVAAYLGSASV